LGQKPGGFAVAQTWRAWPTIIFSCSRKVNPMPHCEVSRIRRSPGIPFSQEAAIEQLLKDYRFLSIFHAHLVKRI
jgi:hypothetical protein